MAVLSLPVHYDDQSVAEHVRRLAPVAVNRPGDSKTPPWIVPPLSGGEVHALGFGALYDTWAHARDERGAISELAPDGPVCGVIARRTNARGAWIAPANEPMRGVVALGRSTSRARREVLQRIQVNVAVPEAHGFALFSADTLSLDDDLRPINVRRLLILLNRLATRLGSTYVFEPNDDAFRRLVQRGFEALLGDLFERGAFAGSTVDTAFQVVTGESLNTRQSVDQGRFIVELRVAPSRPLTFVTIRLVQTGERITVAGA
jgi:phage tail sheath protein FI